VLEFPHAPPPSYSTPAAPPPLQPASIVSMPIGTRCTIKDCPRCTGMNGVQACGITGKPVYPRMTEDGARGMAGALLGLLTFAARLWGRELAPPPQAEIDQLGRALAEVAYRRAGWASGWDDLFALTFALGGFALRVRAAPVVRTPMFASSSSSSRSSPAAANGSHAGAVA